MRKKKTMGEPTDQMRAAARRMLPSHAHDVQVIEACAIGIANERGHVVTWLKEQSWIEDDHACAARLLEAAASVRFCAHRLAPSEADTDD